MFSILLGHPFLNLLPRDNRLSLELFGCFLLLFLLVPLKKKNQFYVRGFSSVLSRVYGRQ